MEQTQTVKEGNSGIMSYTFDPRNAIPPELVDVMYWPRVKVQVPKGMRILITGAGRAIGCGAGIARQAAESGVETIAMGCAREWGEGTLESVKERGASVVPFQVDFDQIDKIAGVVSQIKDALAGGQFDIAMHVSGVTSNKPLDQVTLAERERAMRLNCFGPCEMIDQLEAQGVMASGASHLIVGSNHQFATGGIFDLYATSKCALAGAMRVRAGNYPTQFLNMLCVNWMLSERQVEGHRNQVFNLVDEARKNPTGLIHTGESLWLPILGIHDSNSTGATFLLDGGLSTTLRVNA